jgi:hypothetical protein
MRTKVRLDVLIIGLKAFDSYLYAINKAFL